MPTIITIDGPAGAGKSTIAKELAKQLKFAYLDTGAMYRSLTIKALRNNVSLEDEEALVALLKETSIDFGVDEQHRLTVFLDGEDVTEAIRTEKVTQSTFYVARAPRVRALLVERQRQIGEHKDIVVEGRDTGTVVFPQATKKFYLDARFDERTKRRFKELKEKGVKVQEAQLKEDLQTRDNKDLTRAVGALKVAEDGIVIDSTDLSVDQVVEKMKQVIKSE